MRFSWYFLHFFAAEVHGMMTETSIQRSLWSFLFPSFLAKSIQYRRPTGSICLCMVVGSKSNLGSSGYLPVQSGCTGRNTGAALEKVLQDWQNHIRSKPFSKAQNTVVAVLCQKHDDVRRPCHHRPYDIKLHTDHCYRILSNVQFRCVSTAFSAFFILKCLCQCDQRTWSFRNGPT